MSLGECPGLTGSRGALLFGPLHFTSHMCLAVVSLCYSPGMPRTHWKPETLAPNICVDVVTAEVLVHFSGPQYFSSIRLS